MSHILEIWGIATVTGISCSLIGTFLVLRRLSMMVDAITHTVFLGIGRKNRKPKHRCKQVSIFSSSLSFAYR